MSFGPNATYQPILGDAEGRFPVRTGIQTSQPGYVAPLHSHPYTEILHVLEGRAEAWLEGGEAHPTRPRGHDRHPAGDLTFFPGRRRHADAAAGHARLAPPDRELRGWEADGRARVPGRGG